MHRSKLVTDSAVLEAFRSYEVQERIGNTKVGCALVVTLMPVGSIADYFVYHENLWPFLLLRLICSALAAAIWVLLFTEPGRKRCQWLGLVVPLLPVVFLAGMIAVTEGFASPYYAALNLVLLAVGFVLHWTLWESIVAVVLVLLIYTGAGILHGEVPLVRVLFINYYFIVLMDIIAVVGTYFHERARFREFALRYELNKNREALEGSNRKLVELDQIKSRFFANVSHELRTPLTLLLAPLETLIHRFGGLFDEKTRSTLLTMHANGMRLLKLINDLLELVRMESGRLELKNEPLEVAEFVRGLASAARQVADDKHLQLETYTDPQLGLVLADHDKLEKIVLNLVFNALKFTPAGGRVELRAEKQGEEFVIIVSDTGVGIAEKSLPFVFDRFWQANVTSKRKYQGVGIGLALVKELAEFQSGSVSVQSQEGQGATFTVRFPYQKAGARAPATAEEKAREFDTKTVSSEEWLANLYRRAELFPAITPLQDALKPTEASPHGQLPRALVADDEPDMLRFIKSELDDRFEVIEAINGQIAVEKASQFLPEIILLDVMMPEKDGLQACREIREHAPTHSIPIILLTARADEESKFAALEAGASDFLPKPFSTTELHVRIKNLIESHHYQRKLSKQNQALESTIDQLKETEMQLVQSEKLASLGRMSAGIIHEINNPLNFALTGLFTLRSKRKHIALEQQEEYAEVLQDVEEGLKRVMTIISDLRMFTHPDVTSQDQVEITEIVAPALRFLSNEWKDTVQIEQKLADRQVVWANKNKLIHVTTNLLQNALDAMKQKTFADGEKPTIWIEGRVENDKSILLFRDNGPGIDREHLDKIFDPFFTTKDVGKGMGLGLSICYRIVQEYGGKITVRTEPGKFCEFALEFPVKR